jgi:hypothetical protein
MQSNASGIIGLRPWLYAPLNETSGTAIADASGNGSTGTYLNGVTLGNAGTPIAGVAENGPTFGGGTQFANIAMRSGFFTEAIANGGFALSFWFKAASGIGPVLGFNAGGQQLSIARHSGIAELFQVSLTSPTSGQTVCSDGWDMTGLSSLVDSAWHHVYLGCNFAGPGWFCAIDNTPRGRWNGSAGVYTLNPALLVNPTTPLGIQGVATGSTTATNIQPGSMMHLALYTRLLKVSEWRELYEAGPYIRRPFWRVPKVFTLSPSIWQSIGRRMRSERVEEHRFSDSTNTMPGGQGAVVLPVEQSILRALTGTQSPASQWIGDNSSDGLGIRPWPHIWTNVTTTANVPPGIKVHESVSGGNPYTVYFDVVGLSNASIEVSAANHGETLVPSRITFEVIAQKKSGSGALNLTALGANVPFQYAGETRQVIRATAEMFSAAELTNADGSYLKKAVTIETAGYANCTFQLSYVSAGAIVAAVRAYDPDKPGRALSTFSAGGYTAASFVANHNSCGPLLQAIGAPDYVSINLGTNDEAQNNSSSTYKTNLLALIANLRTKYGVSTLPVLLFSHPVRANATTAQMIASNEYASVLYEICQADPYCAMINVRLVLVEDGWDHANSTYTATAWADATSYAVGNVRSIVVNSTTNETWIFEAITAHTSSASNRPPNATNWKQKAQWYSDGTHWSRIGGALVGGAVGSLMGQLFGDVSGALSGGGGSGISGGAVWLSTGTGLAV